MKNKVVELQKSLEDIKLLFENQNKAMEEQKVVREKVEQDYVNKYQM